MITKPCVTSTTGTVRKTMTQPLPDNPDRLDAAGIYADEKLSRKAVFAEQLVFAAPGAALPTRHGDVHAAIPGVVPTITLAELDVARISQLIMIENATMLIRWHDWHGLLPAAWRQALLLYRGHGRNQRQVKALIQLLPAHCMLAYYPDLDPCGLDICAAYAKLRPLAIVVPAQWQSLSHGHRCNQAQRFAQQAQQLEHIRARLSPFPLLSALLRHVAQQQLAIMQEHVLQLGDLSVLPLQGNS